MTIQTVQLQTYDYGANLTSATLRNVANDTLVATADTVNEVTADSGLYAAVFDETSVIAAGTYRFRAVVGGQPINRYVTLAGTDAEVVQARIDKAVELDSPTITTIKSGLATSAALADVQTDVDATNNYFVTLFDRLGAITGTGANTILGYFRSLWRKDATLSSDLGGTAIPADDSLEALRERVDAGGGGEGAASYEAVVVASMPVGTTVGWPVELIIGDAYRTTTLTAPKLFIRDINQNVLAGLGTKGFADNDFIGTLRLAPLTDSTKELSLPPATIEVTTDDSPGIVFNDATAEAEYFELQIPHDKTALGVIKTRYTAQFVMNWGETREFERTVELGEIKFVRKATAAA